jgi:hypothetical protein
VTWKGQHVIKSVTVVRQGNYLEAERVVWEFDSDADDGTWNPTEVKVTLDERVEHTHQKAVYAVEFMCYDIPEYYTGDELSEMVSDAWETQILNGPEDGEGVDIVRRWEAKMKREQKKEVAGLVNTLEHCLKTGKTETCPGCNQLACRTAPDVFEMRPEVNNRKYCPCYPCISNISSSLNITPAFPPPLHKITWYTMYTYPTVKAFHPQPTLLPSIGSRGEQVPERFRR